MTNQHSLPIIGFTCGDPGGVGPEITLKTLSFYASNFPFIPLLFGSKSLLSHSFFQKIVQNCVFEDFTDVSRCEEGVIYCVDCGTDVDFIPKKPHELNGKASFSFIKTAIEFALNKQCHALVTAPISKESFHLAGIPFTGHTTMLKTYTKSKKVSMAFHTSKLNTILTTIHIPLHEVSQRITKKLLTEKIEHAQLLLQQLKIEDPKIAVAGLNPHASENGLFGTEEGKVIAPVIELFKEKGLQISGPYSPDTVFHRAYQGEFDMVVAMYHDQGLIPIKLFGFHEAVNVTVGLPFIRTSPDHGTAFDRAYKESSSMSSMVAASNLALRLLE